MALPLFDVLPLRENCDFARSWTFTDDAGAAVSFAGASASMMVRADVGDATPALALSSGAGITLSSGTIALVITRTQVAAMIAGSLGLRNRGVFSLLVTDAGGLRAAYVEGIVNIQRSPTR
jgi:hypothetical protein